MPWWTSSISRALASVRLSSIARATILSTSTAIGSSSGSSPCSRESSMTCCTSRESRSLSMCIRPAKRCTASGSSAASITASESSWMAPTGVFSSWLTLATKSRRIDSTRRSRVRSSTRASTSCELSGATRAVTCARRQALALHVQLGLADLAVASYLPDQVAELTHGDLVAADDPHRDRGRGGLQHRVVGVDDQCAAAQHRQHGGDSRAAGPAREAPAGRIWRSLTRNASTTPPPSTAPSTAKTRAWNVGLTSWIVRRDSPKVPFSDRAFKGCSPPVHATTPSVHRCRVGSRPCATPTQTSSTPSATTSC